MRKKTHGHTSSGKTSATYRTWANMKSRCYNQKLPEYERYGGRGIIVCKRWHIFENFLADMGERPKDMSLDRIDNERGYSPDNCRWATNREQALNKRNTPFLEIDGIRKPLNEIAKELGMNESTIRMRLKRGWSAEDAVSASNWKGLNQWTTRFLPRDSN